MNFIFGTTFFILVTLQSISCFVHAIEIHENKKFKPQFYTFYTIGIITSLALITKNNLKICLLLLYGFIMICINFYIISKGSKIKIKNIFKHVLLIVLLIVFVLICDTVFN